MAGFQGLRPKSITNITKQTKPLLLYSLSNYSFIFGSKVYKGSEEFEV